MFMSHSSLCQEVIGSIVLAVNSASPFLTHDSWVSVSILFRVTQEEMAGQYVGREHHPKWFSEAHNIGIHCIECLPKSLNQI